MILTVTAMMTLECLLSDRETPFIFSAWLKWTVNTLIEAAEACLTWAPRLPSVFRPGSSRVKVIPAPA